MAILDDVKDALGVVGDYVDKPLNLHIKTVQDYLKNAGVSGKAVNEGSATGAIIRGVADLWNTNSGGVDFSPVFRDMAIQLAVMYPETENSDESGAGE